MLESRDLLVDSMLCTILMVTCDPHMHTCTGGVACSDVDDVLHARSDVANVLEASAEPADFRGR